MEFYEREHFISRIKSGYVRIKIGDDIVRVHGPSPDIEYVASELYKEVYEQNIFNGLLTDEDVYDILVDNDLWTADDEENLENVLPKHIEHFKIQLFQSLIKTKTQLKVRKYLQAAKDEFERLSRIRHQYDHMTCHGLASFARQHYVIKHCSFYDNKESVNWEIMDINRVLGAWQREFISSEMMRELVINSPWSGEWTSLKANNKIFDSAYLTLEQKSLINLSCMYDRIYESVDCPSEEVIKDNDMLDGWLAVQRQKMDKEKRKRETETQIAVSDKINNAEEIFIPVETAADARRVAELNTFEAQKVKQQRMKHLKDEGKVKVQDFSDVKKKLTMQATQAYRDKMKGGK